MNQVNIFYWDNSIGHYRDSNGSIMNDFYMIAIGYKFPPLANVPLYNPLNLNIDFSGNPILLIGFGVLAFYLLTKGK